MNEDLMESEGVFVDLFWLYEYGLWEKMDVSG